MRNISVFLFLNLVVLCFSSGSQGQYSSAYGKYYCRDPRGSPGDVVCLDGRVTSCQCARSKCRWGETDMPCYDGHSEHNSTSTFLHEDISSALDTPSSCLRTNCNCLAHGNHIAQQPASSFQDCAALCNNFQPACKDWTYVPSRSTCFILTNCNNIRCGYPFNGWVSGPRNCPGEQIKTQGGPLAPSFSIINMISGGRATGTVTFVGNNDPSCSPSFNTTTSQTISVPLDCNPLAVIQATSNNNVQCKPYSTNSPPYPLPNYYVVSVKGSEGGADGCQVCDNATCA